MTDEQVIQEAARWLRAFAKDDDNHIFPKCELVKVGSPGRPYRQCTCGLDQTIQNMEAILKRIDDGKEKPMNYKTEELYNADPNCDHEVYSASGGGVKCKKCPGWFCF